MEKAIRKHFRNLKKCIRYINKKSVKFFSFLGETLLYSTAYLLALTEISFSSLKNGVVSLGKYTFNILTHPREVLLFTGVLIFAAAKSSFDSLKKFYTNIKYSISSIAKPKSKHNSIKIQFTTKNKFRSSFFKRNYKNKPEFELKKDFSFSIEPLKTIKHKPKHIAFFNLKKHKNLKTQSLEL